MEPRTYYVQQSALTDPGRNANWLGDLPRDVRTLQRITHQLVIHYRGDNPLDLGIPASRMAEIDTRYAERMLTRLHELNAKPLAEHREPNERILGCCRDFTILYVMMARHLGIPARARVGFATYFDVDFNVDHVVAEVWDEREHRWRFIDPELGDDHLDRRDGVTLDRLDVPSDRFLTGGAAWAACRAGAADPETFLVDRHLEEPTTRSWPYLVHNVVHDLAALNKREMILWDAWGVIEHDPHDADVQALIDEVARVTRSPDEHFAELQALYECNDRLRVPPTVTSYSPAAERPLLIATNP